MVTDTAKRKTQDFVPDSQKMNRVRPATNALFVALFVVLAAMAIIPVIFVFVVSISSETSIREVGYSFFPIELSNTAYMFLWNERGTILNALGISVLVTGVGTVLGLFLTTTMGYVLSRPVFKLKGFYTWVVFIPMIFNGGMLASYVINTNLLRLSRTRSSSPPRSMARPSCASSGRSCCPSPSRCWRPSRCSWCSATGTTGSNPRCTSPTRACSRCKPC